MTLFKVLPLLLLFSQSSLGTSVFAGDDCVKCGMELPLADSSEISPLQKSLICMPFQGGHIESARANGIELFGSFEKYYANLHRIDCANSPTPVYHVIDYKIFTGELATLIDDLAKLDKATAARLLNKPRKGRRKETMLDLFDRTIEGMITDGSDVKMLQYIRRRFVEIGAKKISELTPVELSLYE